MKAAVLFGIRDLRVTDVKEEQLGPHDVRLAIAAVGLCGSDIHFFQEARIGAFDLVDPLVVGHEPSGVVVETGAAVTRLKVGDRVAIEPNRPCGACPECLRGDYNVCENIGFMGMPPEPGCLAERAVVHERFAHPIPTTMSLEEAALLEPLSVVLWANTRMGGVRLADRVLVGGAGPVGILAARVARAAGAAEVCVLDVDPERLAIVAGEPRTTAVDVGGGWGAVDDDYDCYFECTNAQSTLSEGLKHLKRRGRAVMVGVPPTSDIAVPTKDMRWRELTLAFSFRYADTWPRAIQLVATNVVGVKDLVTRRFALDDAPRAFEEAAAHRVGIKAIVVVGDADQARASRAT